MIAPLLWPLRTTSHRATTSTRVEPWEETHEQFAARRQQELAAIPYWPLTAAELALPTPCNSDGCSCCLSWKRVLTGRDDDLDALRAEVERLRRQRSTTVTPAPVTPTRFGIGVGQAAGQ